MERVKVAKNSGSFWGACYATQSSANVSRCMSCQCASHKLPKRTKLRPARAYCVRVGFWQRGWIVNFRCLASPCLRAVSVSMGDPRPRPPRTAIPPLGLPVSFSLQPEQSRSLSAPSPSFALAVHSSSKTPSSARPWTWVPASNCCTTCFWFQTLEVPLDLLDLLDLLHHLPTRTHSPLPAVYCSQVSTTLSHLPPTIQLGHTKLAVSSPLKHVTTTQQRYQSFNFAE